ncbi:methyltransferase type 11 [Candidatus Scalindua japonica]|uniref:Methyltransferase type 11 n=1 Tax=Candidatus Scalindua japonica TaxID=1284222 RepID=A0A286TX26_9BACT|nr:class I SAM-dependent methyltransferase [Candidatus Scalindua japonica]GAX60425.1 methyltransferase type 11 [Candidatus Scalindua japonica]
MNNNDKIKDDSGRIQTIHESEKNYFDNKAQTESEEFEKGGWFVDHTRHKAVLKIWGLDESLNGKKVLECGCGTGFFTTLLAKIGAEVWCFDLSSKCVDLTKKRAELNKTGDKINARVASFENMDYEDESFDIVLGKNILHHIPDIDAAGKQIRRILKTGGKAVFYELNASNPILIFFRNHIIGKTRLIPKLGTHDEHPLTADEVEKLSRIFNHRCKISYPKFRFFGKFDRQVFQQRYKPISFFLEGIDNMIYLFFPPLRKYSYKILLEFEK